MMFPRNRVIGLSISLLLVLSVLGACGPESTPLAAPSVSEIDAQPSTTITVGEEATLAVTASGTGLTFEWTAVKGQVSSSSPEVPSALYIAPDSPGSDTVTVKVTSGDNSTFRSITFNVIPRPTEVPTQTPTPAPTATPTLGPTSTPTITPTPVPPAIEIFPQSEQGQAWHWNNDGQFIPRYVENEACRHSGPYGLQVTYAMSGDENGGWGVHWTNAPTGSFNASAFSTFTFWVKGTSGGELFQIGLKDTGGREVKIESEDLVIVSAAEWRQVQAELSDFTDVNTASVENVNLGFNSDHGSGTICLDDFAFE